MIGIPDNTRQIWWDDRIELVREERRDHPNALIAPIVNWQITYGGYTSYPNGEEGAKAAMEALGYKLGEPWHGNYKTEEIFD